MLRKYAQFDKRNGLSGINLGRDLVTLYLEGLQKLVIFSVIMVMTETVIFTSA